MSKRSLTRAYTRLAVPAALLTLLAPRPALALQSLDEFVAASKTRNLEGREAQAVAEQRADEARQAWSRLGPTFVARAGYTRNQREAATYFLPPGSPPGTAPTKITITPFDQLEATFSLNVPLIDVGSWQRIGAAEANADAAKVRAQAAGQDVEKVVTRTYYQVVAMEATIVAARRSLATSSESRVIVLARKEAGSASELDAERSRAEVERAKQVVVSAEQARSVARRSLESLSGLTPSDGSVPLPEDSLAEEAPLASLEPGALMLPSVRAASLEARAARRNADAAWSAFYPTIVANATERLTNATGFTGNVATWSLGVTATLTLDLSTYFGAKAQGSARALADVRERRAQQNARDDLHTAYQDVRAQIAKVRAARAEADASARAAKLARERYAAGAATQFEVMQADRDAFSGEMARIQAQADLAYARALLRIDSGRGRGGVARGPIHPGVARRSAALGGAL